MRAVGVFAEKLEKVVEELLAGFLLFELFRGYASNFNDKTSSYNLKIKNADIFYARMAFFFFFAGPVPVVLFAFSASFADVSLFLPAAASSSLAYVLF